MPSSDSSSSTSFDSSSSSDTSQRAPVIAILPPLPCYTIDLSLPPSQRYTKICEDFRSELVQFKQLYRTVLGLSRSPRLAGGIARFLLKRVHDREETLEIKAIAKDSGLRLCEVVALNTFLDMFSGCVSGGVRAVAPFEESRGQVATEGMEEKETMLHFRNLDWEMDILRDLLIRVEYVREGRIVARAVTYAGYTGVLTGVREGLSMSLNYRLRIHSRSSTMAHYFHYLAVLMGSRPSTPSQLRSILLSPGPAPSLDEVTHHFQGTTSGPCYLTFCSPDEVVILEKHLNGLHVTDRRLEEAALRTGNCPAPPPESSVGSSNRDGVRRNKEFAVVTNHDESSESWPPSKWARAWKTRKIRNAGGADKIMGDSMERKKCVAELFNQTRQAEGKVTLERIKEWLRTRPARNETTHFSCIMDPCAPGGGMVWVEGCDTV